MLALLNAQWAAPAIAAGPAASDTPGPVDHYAYQHSETLLETGRLQQQRGDHDGAAASYQQARQAVRASLGLYSEQQIPIMERLLESRLFAGEWNEFRQDMEQLGRLALRIHAEEPEALADTYSRMADWHLIAATTRANAASPWHLVQARHLNWKAFTVLEQHGNPIDPHLPRLLYGIALNHYYTVNAIRILDTGSHGFRHDEPAIANDRLVTPGESSRRSYRIGMELLQRIGALHGEESTDSLSAALAHVYLADWHLLFGHGDRAQESYLNAYNALLDGGIAADHLERYFDRDIMLPRDRLELDADRIFNAADNTEQEQLRFVAWSSLLPGISRPDAQLPVRWAGAGHGDEPMRATLTLGRESPGAGNPGRFGYRVTAVELEDPADGSLQRRAITDLENLHFRPRIRDGRIVSEHRLELDYLLPTWPGFVLPATQE